MKLRILTGMVFSICMMATACFAQGAPVAAGQAPEVKTIFSFKTEVGLTDDQEDKLKALLYDEQALINNHNDALKNLGGELSKLIDSKADISVIKSKLEDMAKIQVEISIVNIEDARKIETILTPAQIDKWKEIQKSFAPKP